MCYNVNYLTKKRMDYAKRLGGRISQAEIDKEFDIIESKVPGAYYATGFAHPDLPVITNEIKDKIQMYSWGLIPPWVKDPKQAVDLSNRTLNARGEEMFDKPSFRNAARNKRCLILIDGFFDYHWKNGVAYPYYIKLKSDEPMLLGGLWETWQYVPEHIARQTCSIVTCEANPMMKQIHNKPNASEGSRMPLIIPRELEDDWLSDTKDSIDQEIIRNVIAPYSDDEMESYTVPRLKGKEGVGNHPSAINPFTYPELVTLF